MAAEETTALIAADANDAASALTAHVALEPVPREDTVSGAPTQGITEIGSIAGVETGIWQLTAGTVTDTEVDELFVVLSGSATVEILSGPEEGRVVTVSTGDVMRLVGGTRTRWSVEDHIRKIYIAAE